MLESPLLVGILISVVSSGVTGIIVIYGVVNGLRVHIDYIRESANKAHTRLDDHIKSH